MSAFPVLQLESGSPTEVGSRGRRGREFRLRQFVFVNENILLHRAAAAQRPHAGILTREARAGDQRELRALVGDISLEEHGQVLRPWRAGGGLKVPFGRFGGVELSLHLHPHRAIVCKVPSQDVPVEPTIETESVLARVMRHVVRQLAFHGVSHNGDVAHLLMATIIVGECLAVGDATSVGAVQKNAGSVAVGNGIGHLAEIRIAEIDSVEAISGHNEPVNHDADPSADVIPQVFRW